ncbi:MAG TPA: RpiB/LacA/LacB family sugar-phosphate isomerase [Magnetospirillaceae bacterium]|nr:RpiB/LacA/LacB family sugar-phosphate isomerase [Magnetospirillaceae bacterium]
MRILIANDHGALDLKRRIASHLTARGHEIIDLGTGSEKSVDYSDKGFEAAREFLKGGYDLGIVLCGTGIGISIAANRHRGIRCALVHDLYTAGMARAHNNANFLAFGGRVEYKIPVEDILDRFLESRYEGGRHAPRVAKLDGPRPS